MPLPVLPRRLAGEVAESPSYFSFLPDFELGLLPQALLTPSLPPPVCVSDSGFLNE